MMDKNRYRNDPHVFVLDMSDTEKKKSSYINLMFVIGIAAVWILAGMVNQDSSRTGWIVFLYLFTYLPLIYALFGVAVYWESGTVMSCLQYQQGLLRIRRSLLAVLVMDALGILAELLFIFLYRMEIHAVRELAYLFLHLPVIALVMIYGYYYDHTYVSGLQEMEHG